MLAGGGRVVVIDYEDRPQSCRERLRALGVDDRVLVDTTRFRYVRPDEPAPERPELEELVGDASLVVIDGVTEAMNIEDLDANNNGGVAEFMRRLPRPIASFGAAVIAIDHVRKGAGNRADRGGIGAQHKIAGVDGAVFRMDTIEHLHRGGRGRFSVKVTKDRHGHVRAHDLGGGVVATLELVSDPEGPMAATLAPEVARGPDLVAVTERIIGHLDEHPGANKTDLRALGNSDTVDEAIRSLIDEDVIEVRKEGNAHCHYLVPEPPT